MATRKSHVHAPANPRYGAPVSSVAFALCRIAVDRGATKDAKNVLESMTVAIELWEERAAIREESGAPRDRAELDALDDVAAIMAVLPSRPT